MMAVNFEVPRVVPANVVHPASEVCPVGPDMPEDPGAPDPEVPDNVVPMPSPSHGETHNHTDLRNAERLVEQHGADLRYVTTWKKCLAWGGTRWKVESDDGEFTRRAVKVVRRMLAEARRAVKDATEKALAATEKHGRGSPQADKADTELAAAKAAHAWAVRSQSAKALAAMVSLAKTAPEIRISHEALDVDPLLLNCPNGTVDLRTGKLREHRREDLITKSTAAPCDPDARSELWGRVLLEAMNGDAELVAYFQRAAGYSCTGLASEEKLFMPIGPTSGGKSTIVQSLVEALGDYARTADFEAFLAQKNPGGPKNEIARLAGARLVASIEVDKGRKLAQSLIKTLTGGDVVTARFLYSEAFEFKPTFKLWLVANDAPIVSDDDGAMWRRIHRIPFPNTVPRERRDPRVKGELVDVARSGAAVLAWVVAGCVAWREKGLGTAAAVEQATEAYRAESDPLREFIAEACALKLGAQVERKVLRDAFEAWSAEAGGRSALDGREFTKRVRLLPGVGETRVSSGRFWTGIELVGQAQQAFGDT